MSWRRRCPERPMPTHRVSENGRPGQRSAGAPLSCAGGCGSCHSAAGAKVSLRRPPLARGPGARAPGPAGLALRSGERGLGSAPSACHWNQRSPASCGRRAAGAALLLCACLPLACPPLPRPPPPLRPCDPRARSPRRGRHELLVW